MAIDIESIQWDDNNRARAHALIRATEDEINQAIENRDNTKLNTGDHPATHVIYGRTDGGRPLVIPVVHDPTTCRVRPITAWKDDSR